MTQLDPYYLCCSPESADPRTVTAEQRVEELDRELNHRRGVYPRWIASGQLSQEEADRALTLFEVLLDDARARQALIVWHDGGKQAAAWAALQQLNARVAGHLTRTSWAELVGALRREIDLRRRHYPRWIAGGTLEPMQARHRLERLEAVHFDWWRHGRHFMPDQLAHEPWTASATQLAIYFAAYRPHRARFDPNSHRGDYLIRPPKVETEHQRAMAL